MQQRAGTEPSVSGAALRDGSRVGIRKKSRRGWALWTGARPIRPGKQQAGHHEHVQVWFGFVRMPEATKTRAACGARAGRARAGNAGLTAGRCSAATPEVPWRAISRNQADPQTDAARRSAGLWQARCVEPGAYAAGAGATAGPGPRAGEGAAPGAPPPCSRLEERGCLSKPARHAWLH